jgi:hypothetical protein
VIFVYINFDHSFILLKIFLKYEKLKYILKINDVINHIIFDFFIF